MATIHKYRYDGSVYTLDELHALGILLSSTTPTKTTVYGLGTYSGQTATRYVGSHGSKKLHIELWAESGGVRKYANYILLVPDETGEYAFADFWAFFDNGDYQYSVEFDYLNDLLLGWTLINQEGVDFGWGEITSSGYEVYLDGVKTDSFPDEMLATIPPTDGVCMYHNQFSDTIDVNGVVDAMVKLSDSTFVYYATQAACDEDWSTEEPYQIVYTNRAASLTTYVTGSSSFQPCYDSDGELARTLKTINLIAYYSDGAWKEPISSIVLHEYTYRAGATTYYYVFGWKVTDGSTIKVSAFKYTLS